MMKLAEITTSILIIKCVCYMSKNNDNDDDDLFKILDHFAIHNNNNNNKVLERSQKN